MIIGSDPINLTTGLAALLESPQEDRVTPLLEHDLPPDDGSEAMDERRAQLLAAADAARNWVHARRASWPDEQAAIESGAFQVPASLPQPNAPVPSASPPPSWVAPVKPLAPPQPRPAQDFRPPPEPPASPGDVAAPEQPDWAPKPPVYPDWSPAAPTYPDWAPDPPAYPEWAPEPPAESHDPAPPALQAYLPAPVPPSARAVPQPAVHSDRRASAKATADDVFAPAHEPPTPFAERIAELVRAAGASVFRWSLRLGAAAVVLALVAVAGSAAHTYWLKLSAPKMGTAILETTPPGSQVIVDGEAMGTTPLKAELTAGPHVVELRYRNASRTIKIEVTANNSIVERLDWTAKPTGRLSVTSDPTGARVLVDGSDRGATPLTVDGLSVGSHEVVLESDKGSVRRSVTVAANRTVQLTESIYPGWVRLFSPVDLEISDGTRVLRKDERNQVMLPSGSRELRFENRALGYHEVRRIHLEPGETITLSIVPTPTKITVEATLPAEVWIDDERVGDTPLVDAPIDLGTRVVTVKSPTGGERRFTLTVTVEPIRLDVDFSKP